MFLDEPLNVSEESFKRIVLQAKLPVLVDFWASWCGPCKVMAGAIKKIAREFGGKVLVAKVNTEDYPQLSQRYYITGVPTTVFFLDGKEIGRESGALSEVQIKQKINQLFHL